MLSWIILAGSVVVAFIIGCELGNKKVSVARWIYRIILAVAAIVLFFVPIPNLSEWVFKIVIAAAILYFVLGKTEIKKLFRRVRPEQQDDDANDV